MKEKGPEHNPVPFSKALFHNLKFIDAGYESKPGLNEMNDAGAVNEAHGEDFSFKSFRLPVHSAGSIIQKVRMGPRCIFGAFF